MRDLEVRVDRTSPVPLYFQVAEQLEQSISAGVLAPGDRLDNETVLADRLGLSRPTMRQAIAHLVDKGLLVRKRGVGTQVVQSKVRRSIELSSLYDDLARENKRPRTRLLTHETAPATAEVSMALGVAPDEPVLHLERLRYAEDEPLALMRNWLPVGIAPLTRETLQEHGLYELLRRRGVHMRVARQVIGARAATTAEGRLLDEGRGAPLLTMSRTTYDDGGAPVEYGAHVYRASRYSFELMLVER